MKIGMKESIFRRTLFTCLTICVCNTLYSQEILQQLQQIQQLEKSGNFQDAKTSFENIYSQNPDNILVFTRFKDFLMGIQDYRRVLEIINTRKQKHPDDFKLDIWKAQIMYKLGKQDDALKTWQTVIDNNASNLSVYLHVADVMTAENLLDKAADVYLAARKIKKRDDLFCLNLANIHIARMDYKNATHELLMYLKTIPEQYGLVEKQFFEFVNSDKAKQVVTDQIKKAIIAEPSEKTLKTLLINIYIRIGDYTEGLKIAVEAEKQTADSPKGETLYYFGNKAFEAGAHKTAATAFAELLSICPNYQQKILVFYQLAQCYNALGEYDRAVNEYRHVASVADNKILQTQALISFGLILKDKLYNYEEAMETFQKVENNPLSLYDRLTIQLETGQCYVALGKLEQAETIFRKSLELKSEYQSKNEQMIRARILLADVCYLQGKFNEALKLFDGLKSEKLDAQSVQNPVLNDALERNLFMKQFYERSPDPLRVFIQADLLKRQRRFDEAVSILDSLTLRWPDDPVTVYGIFNRGEIEFQSGHYEKSLENFDFLSTRFASHLLADRALSYAGLACEKMGRKKEALKRYDRLLLKYPGSMQADEIRRRIQDMEKK